MFLTGEIIHNPHVNDQLRAQGIRFLSDPDEDAAPSAPDDVVILPAFGVTVEELQRLSAAGCTLVDTTCGSVLNVWKNVVALRADGFTSVIHGKYWHEETRATASQALQAAAAITWSCSTAPKRRSACDYIRRPRRRRDRGGRFSTGSREAVSPGLRPGPAPGARRLRQPDDDAEHRIAGGRRDVPGRRCASGTARPSWPQRFRAFDTICSATQDRQDAVVQLLAEEPVDLMLVIGGYNSSNTCNLARICADSVPTYHIADPDGLLSADEIRHRSVADKAEIVSTGWLPAAGPVRVGLTSGASTPDNLVEVVVRRLEQYVGASERESDGRKTGDPAPAPLP